MSKLLFLLIGVVVFSKTNGTPKSRQASLIPDESEDEFSVDDWSELDAIYPGDPYTEGLHVPEKRGSRDSLMRRSTLDKNFMRFGRSGFFPGERCCRQKDLVGLAESYASVSDPISLTKRETDSNFMRFGRGSTDNFMRFGKGGDNFMRFGKGGDNFMRFGRPEKDKGNFMRFGKGGDNFMRFGRPEKDKGNFMRFGKDDKGNFMRFGKDDKGNFMRFGRGKDNNFMRFGRGDKDNFIRFGRSDDYTHNPDGTDDEDEVEESDTFTRPAKSDNFIRFGKNPNFIRYGKSGGKDDSFIRFGKSGRNGTNFLRFGRELGEDSDGEDGTKTNLTTRRKRMTTEGESPYNRRARSPELMEDVLPETKRSAIEESITKPNLLKFISFINRNHPNWDGNDAKSFFPPVQRNPALKPNTETYKRKQDGSGFIRFG